MITELFLYRPVAWRFLRWMKKHKKTVSWWKKHKALIISISIGFAPLMVYVKTQTNLWRTVVTWRTEFGYPEDAKYGEIPYRFFRKHGTEIRYYRDGSKQWEAPYVKGKMHGTEIWYYPDGSKSSETPYVNGKQHGTEIKYFKDGSTKTSEWVHGTGTDIWYREDGSKRLETVYENGKFISHKFF